ncbi:MAG: hypothetical protein PVH50_13005 [Anaerolineae bacterium]|jgi:hypothetical protein
MTRPDERYISYLVRLWPIADSGELVWRASLESPRTGERRGFADLSALCAFLEREVKHATERQTMPLPNDA